VRLNVWHAVVIEEEAVVELGPFEAGLADFSHDCETGLLRGKLESVGLLGCPMSDSNGCSLLRRHWDPPIADNKPLRRLRLFCCSHNIDLRRTRGVIKDENGGYHHFNVVFFEDFCQSVNIVVVHRENRVVYILGFGGLGSDKLVVARIALPKAHSPFETGQ
jgi:hypothetical protein